MLGAPSRFRRASEERLASAVLNRTDGRRTGGVERRQRICEQLLEHSYLVLDLNPPSALPDISWIRPGEVAWSWWSGDFASNVDFKPGMNTATMIHYTDLSHSPCLGREVRSYLHTRRVRLYRRHTTPARGEIRGIWNWL